MSSLKVASPLFFLIAFLSLWEGLVRGLDVPTYILPAPVEIIIDIFSRWSYLEVHTYVTLGRVLAGFAIGVLGAYGLALIMAYSKPLERGLMPNLVAFRSVPSVAFVPLLVMWLGFTGWPIILTASIISFFPVVVNCVTGFNSVDYSIVEMMNSFAASKWQIFRYVRIQACMPYFLSALKIAITLAVIGVVVGEWIGTEAGLGFLLLLANNYVDTLLLFDAILLLAIMGTSLYVVTALSESYLLKWREPAL